MHSCDASFIETDRKILERNFNVIDLNYFSITGVFKLLKGIIRADIGFAWFEQDHAFFTVLFSKIWGKKSIVVSASSFAFTEQWDENVSSFKSKFFQKLAVKYADLVLADSRYKETSILNHIKGDNVKLIYLGFDTKKFTPINEKEDMIITVGQVTDSNLRRKGLDMFVRVAQYFPKIKFVLIGEHVDSSIEKLKKIAPNNVEFTGWISDDDLIRYMQRAKVYAQFSTMESFGCSVAEAMLCGCVPIVTKIGALPEVVGDAGFYNEHGDLEGSIKALKMALESDMYEKVRKRIIDRFPLEERERQIIKNIHELMDTDK